MQFQGNIGILVFGRRILKKNPKAVLQFFLEREQLESALSEKDYWEVGLIEILENISRFGRVGIFFDRKNKEIPDFFEKINITKIAYTRSDKRAVKSPKISMYEMQVLTHMAEEGLSDCVEFRRLTRKFIRRAKKANCDTLFFPENIFGEEKTKKILQQIAGSQLKVFTPCDFFNEKTEESKYQKIEIFYKKEDPVFLKKRAEAILEIKLKESCFILQ